MVVVIKKRARKAFYDPVHVWEASVLISTYGTWMNPRTSGSWAIVCTLQEKLERAFTYNTGLLQLHDAMHASTRLLWNKAQYKRKTM